MTIQFHCPFCQKLLRTPDDKAGVKANCPGCGETVTVPSPEHEASQADPSMEDIGVASGARPDEPDSAAAEGRVAAAADRSAGETKECPMCGAEIQRAAKRCRFCGESLVDREDAAERELIDAGEIISRAWNIYQANLWPLVAATLIVLGIGLVAFFAGYIGIVFVFLALFGAGQGQPGPDALTIVGFVALIVLFLFFLLAVNAFVQGGYYLLMIRVARGKQADLGDLFSVGPFFWRLFLGNMLFTLMMYAGLAAFIVPGFFVVLMFWPFAFVIVDQDSDLIESFRKSKDLTNGNLAAVFLLGLAAMGFNLVGEMACLVGMLFSFPLGALLFAVAYCRMSGQPTAGTRRVPVAP